MNFPTLPPSDPVLEPGAYSGETWIRPDAYHASQRLSRSQIARLDPSVGTPAEYIWHSAHPPKASLAMVRGDAVHTLAQEPERFEAEYAYPPPGLNRTRKADKLAWAAFMDASGWELDESAEHLWSPGPNAKRIVGFAHEDGKSGKLSYGDCEIVRSMGAAIASDPALSAVLQGKGLTEATFAWDEEPIDGDGATLHFRMRPDRVNFTRDGSAMIDFKTSARGISPDKWRKVVELDRLYFQAGMYEHGYAEATDDRISGFFHVVTQAEPPFLSAVYRLDEEYLAAGRAEFFTACRILRRCIADDEWPGYSRSIVNLEPSDWFTKRR
jgi:hypothetical protein